MHYIKTKDGKTHTIEEYGFDKTTATICLDNWKVVTLKRYYRHERTWDDHMGNTPCGDYVIVAIPISNGKKERKRVYLNFGR